MLAHELTHVAHRDVLVMTVASSAGIVAGMLTRGAQFGGLSAAAAATTAAAPAVLIALVVSLVVYAVSFLLLRLLSRYRELCADRSGAYLTEAAGARLGADEDLRRESAPSRRRTCAPAARSTRSSSSRPSRGISMQDADGHPPLARAAPRAAGPHPGRARPADGAEACAGCDAVTGRRQARQANNLDALFLIPSAAITLQTAAGLHARPGRAPSATARRPARRSPRRRTRSLALLDDDPEAPDVEVSRDEFGFTWLVVDGDPDDTGRPVHRPARRQHHASRRRASSPACCARW